MLIGMKMWLEMQKPNIASAISAKYSGGLLDPNLQTHILITMLEPSRTEELPSKFRVEITPFLPHKSLL